MSRQVRLVAADYEDKTLIRNLMQFYLYEMSQYGGSAGPNRYGLFEYRYLDHYWAPDGIAEGRVPFLIMVGESATGFALRNSWAVLERANTASDVAEFFVLPRWRRQGVGRAAAIALFERFPGPWEVRELRANAPAQHFWRSVIGAYTGGAFREIDLQSAVWDGPVQTFTAGVDV